MRTITLLLIPALLSAQHGFFGHASTGNVLGQGFSYYIDAANGSDNLLTNSGTNPSTAFASISPLAVQNLIKWSADFTNVYWAKNQSATTPATDEITFGTNDASEIYAVASTNTVVQDFVITCDAREITGTGKMRLELVSTTPTVEHISSDFSLTTSWQTITYTMSGFSSSDVSPRLRNGSNHLVHTVQIRNLRVNSQQIGASSGSPSVYVQTTSASLGDCTHTPCNWASLADSTHPIGLKAGSTWRQEFDIINAGATIGRYGFGANPTFDGTSALTNASFAPVSGNVYSQVITLPSGDSPSDPGWYTSVWETIPGHARTRLQNCGSTTSVNPYCHGGNVAAVQGQAGSYLAVIISSGPTYTLNIQASDASDPRSNGYLYEFAARQYGINASAISGITLKGVNTQRSINANGSLQVGQNGTLINVQAQEGTKHNMLYDAGAFLNNVVATTYDYGGLGAVPIQGFGAASATLGMTYVNVLGGVYEHTGTIGTTFAFSKATNCSSGPDHALSIGTNSVTATLTGSISYLTGMGFTNSTNVYLVNDAIIGFTGSDQYGVYCPSCAVLSVIGTTITGPGTQAGTVGISLGAAGTLIAQNNTITQAYQGISFAAGSNVTATGNTVNIGQYWIYTLGSPGSLVSDTNTFVGYNSSSFASLNGVVSSYAAWKALGYDTHSTP